MADYKIHVENIVPADDTYHHLNIRVNGGSHKVYLDDGLLEDKDQKFITQIPEDICVMCMKPQEEVGELIMHQIIYPYNYSQKRICNGCREKVRTSIARALKEAGWDG